jgi:ribose 5-phosphate isomerase B
MRIALGSDHRGFAVKQRLASVLAKSGFEVIDLGVTSGEGSADYPDFAIPVSEAVGHGDVQKGILICGTGFGMCIAANKVQGVRAVTCRDPIEAEMSRRHNDANVLCMSADFLGQDLIDRMVNIWLTTEFEGGRHQRRVEKITKYEENGCKDTSCK